MKRNVLYALLPLTMMSSLSACAGYPPLTYTAEPIEARVIDADAQQPLAGVIVVAHWELERGTVGGNVPAGQLMVMETTTDKDGKFAFAGWGPKTVWDSFLLDNDPELLLFKSGYRYQALRNEYDSSIELRTRSVRRSQWNGKTIKMERFVGGLKEYEGHLSFLKGSLRFVEDDCNWKRVPKMILALSELRKVFRANRIDSGVYSADYFEGLPKEELQKCGPPRQFFKEQQR